MDNTDWGDKRPIKIPVKNFTEDMWNNWQRTVKEDAMQLRINWSQHYMGPETRAQVLQNMMIKAADEVMMAHATIRHKIGKETAADYHEEQIKRLRTVIRWTKDLSMEDLSRLTANNQTMHEVQFRRNVPNNLLVKLKRCCPQGRKLVLTKAVEKQLQYHMHMKNRILDKQASGLLDAARNVKNVNDACRAVRALKGEAGMVHVTTVYKENDIEAALTNGAEETRKWPGVEKGSTK
jgi:hypothetical protein